VGQSHNDAWFDSGDEGCPAAGSVSSPSAEDNRPLVVGELREDIEFVQAVHATGRSKLIVCALWTEVCMAFTALYALRDGYDVDPVVDAIAGTSPEAHRAGLDRVVQAGRQPISWVSLACELQRDWARQETVPAIVEIVLTDRQLKE
jgi:nicotinamidase-related amidase